MEAGKLRHRVALQSDAGEGTYDTHGQITANWTTQKRLWAEITMLTGREAEQARQTYAAATVRIRTRYIPEIARQPHPGVRKRITHTDPYGNTQTYNIGHIDNVEGRNRELVLLCSEEV